MGGHTVIGVIQEALKEEKAREEETESEITKRRELRKSLNRRVSFASHATIRYSYLSRKVIDLDCFLRQGRLRGLRVRRRGLDFIWIIHLLQTESQLENYRLDHIFRFLIPRHLLSKISEDLNCSLLLC
jgi:hypothetical protein